MSSWKDHIVFSESLSELFKLQKMNKCELVRHKTKIETLFKRGWPGTTKYKYSNISA